MTKIEPPSLGPLLGRYEYTDATSDKFWLVEFDPKALSYVTSWGKNGYPHQGQKFGLTGQEALKKVQEKITKGYRKVAGDPGEERRSAAERVAMKRAARQEELSAAEEFMMELKKL